MPLTADFLDLANTQPLITSLPYCRLLVNSGFPAGAAWLASAEQHPDIS